MLKWSILIRISINIRFFVKKSSYWIINIKNMISRFNITTIYKYIIFFWLFNIKNWFIYYKLFIDNNFIFFQLINVPWNQFFSPIAKQIIYILKIFIIIFLILIRLYHFYNSLIKRFNSFLKFFGSILFLTFFKRQD